MVGALVQWLNHATAGIAAVSLVFLHNAITTATVPAITFILAAEMGGNPQLTLCFVYREGINFLRTAQLLPS